MSTTAIASLDAPRAPKTLEDAGISRDLVTQLVLKTLHLSGELTGTELARRLGLPFLAIEPILTVIKQQHQCEISGGAFGSPTYRYRITDAGRARAMLFMEHNHY
jgi:predicted ArsR family transcriptional regulator